MSTTRSARFISESPGVWGAESPQSALVVAGLRGAGLVGGPERLATATARDRVRVAEREAAPHEGVDEVDLGALDVHRAHWIDDDAHALHLDDRVVLFRAVGEGHAVRETGAATRCDIDAQREARPILLRDDLAQLVRRSLGQRDHGNVGRDGFALLDRHDWHLRSRKANHNRGSRQKTSKNGPKSRQIRGLNSKSWPRRCITRKCSIRLARKPQLAGSTRRGSACARSPGLRPCATEPGSGSQPERATCTFPRTAISASIRAATSRCGSTICNKPRTGCAGRGRASRRPIRSPGGSASTSSTRSATRSSWMKFNDLPLLATSEPRVRYRLAR